MAIRLREVNGVQVALCAARSVPKPDDIYLHDGWHHALYVKFDLDFASEGRTGPIYADSAEAVVTEREESNNANRTEWDAFSPPPETHRDERAERVKEAARLRLAPTIACAPGAPFALR